MKSCDRGIAPNYIRSSIFRTSSGFKRNGVCDNRKIISLLILHNKLTRVKQIKAFQVYMRSRIYYIIQMVLTISEIREDWKVPRNVIFIRVLDFSILQREQTSEINAGFFDIIVKPMIQIIERCDMIFNDQNLTNYLMGAQINALIATEQCALIITPEL